MTIFEKYNIILPTYEKLERPALTLEEICKIYAEELDPMGNPARQVECFLRYRLTGKVEYVHPQGVADVVIKSGVTLEVKTGHGWAIEPNFRTLEDLEDFLDERKNPMIKASHVAYLSHRAVSGTDCDDCLFFTAGQFLAILGKYGKLVAKESRGMWGIAMKPWITEGYAQKSSPKVEAQIREDLEEIGLILEEFAEKHGLDLYEI